MRARYVCGIADAWRAAAGLLNASALVVLDRRYSIIPFVLSSNSDVHMIQRVTSHNDHESLYKKY